jgi:hypothetical protein
MRTFRAEALTFSWLPGGWRWFGDQGGRAAVSQDIGVHPILHGLLAVPAKQGIRATGAADASESWREVVPVNLNGSDIILLEKPPDQFRGGFALGFGHGFLHGRDVFDDDGTGVGPPAMVGPFAIRDHLIDVAIPVDHVMGRNLPPGW